MTFSDLFKLVQDWRAANGRQPTEGLLHPIDADELTQSQPHGEGQAAPDVGYALGVTWRQDASVPRGTVQLS